MCRESFYDFFLRFWSTVVAEPLSLNWHMKILCDELQTVAERVFKRQPKEYDLIVNVAPGSTKSTIASVMFPAWCWARQPSFRAICGSYADRLSLFLANQSRRVINSEKYAALFPEVQIVSEGKGLLETSQGGQRLATSTGGSVTGFHGHVIIIDDPLNPREAVSETMGTTANEWFDHSLMSRAVDKRVTPLILIMQRLSQDDPTGHFINRNTGTPIRHICLPAELSPNVRPRALRALYSDDGLFDPVRLPRKTLRAAEEELGPYAYAGQYDQHPIPRGERMFNTDLIKLVEHPGRFRKIVRYWDKAGTGGGGAFTVGVKMGLGFDGDFWVLDVVRGQWEAAQRERMIAQIAKLDGKSVHVGVEQEGGSGGKESAQGTLRRLAGYRVKLDKPVGDKVLRADEFAVQVNGGNVRMLRGNWNAAYLNELMYFPKSKFKDQVDASSGAFNLLAGKRLRVGAF